MVCLLVPLLRFLPNEGCTARPMIKGWGALALCVPNCRRDPQVASCGCRPLEEAMTAFNDTLSHKERHQSSSALEADKEERPACELRSLFSWDSVISLLDAQQQPHLCKCSCSEDAEACGTVEGKDTSSGSSVVCYHCSERLPDALMSKQEVLCFFNHELEQERIAAESAANEAISMILRLQVEKAALQMEAKHYQQVLEAKTLYDEETISQLHAIISSQEADRLVLEQEIHECRQTLLKYSEIDTEKGLLGCEGVSPKGLVRADMGPLFTQKALCRMPSRGNGRSLRPLSLEEKFNHIAMQTMEDAQLPELYSLECRDEAKTKHVVSMSTGDPTLNLNSGNSALGAFGLIHGAYVKLHDCLNESLELEGLKGDTEKKCLDEVVKDCWLKILMQLSKLYKQIEGLGIFGFEGDCRLAKCQECSSEFRNGFTQMQQKFSHMNSWCDIMVITDGCIRNLAEKFATCQTRLYALETTQRAMTDAFEITKENKWKADKVLVIAADIMREFLSFTGLGCDILDLLHILMMYLTRVVALVDDAKCAETGLNSKKNTYVMNQDGTVAADGKQPESVRSSSQGDSDLPQEMDGKMSKLAFLWSSSLEWMSNEKCRAETAFSGWDHI